MRKPLNYPLKLVTGTILGPFVITVFTDDGSTPLDITGYSVFAEVRARAGASTLIIDLNPSIQDGPAGEIFIPKLTDEFSFDMKFIRAKWSVILETPSGDRLPPIIEARFIIAGTPTHPEE